VREQGLLTSVTGRNGRLPSRHDCPVRFLPTGYPDAPIALLVLTQSIPRTRLDGYPMAFPSVSPLSLPLSLVSSLYALGLLSVGVGGGVGSGWVGGAGR
jgi:hypothetical protein